MVIYARSVSDIGMSLIRPTVNHLYGNFLSHTGQRTGMLAVYLLDRKSDR